MDRKLVLVEDKFNIYIMFGGKLSEGASFADVKSVENVTRMRCLKWDRSMAYYCNMRQ
jgi:hypothetical protein